MGTPNDPWRVDYESESDQEAASKKENPSYIPGRWFQPMCVPEGGEARVRILRKGRGEPLGDWVDGEV